MSTKKEHYDKGLDLFGQSNFEGAIQEYKKALEFDPNDGEIYMAISMSYLRMKDLDPALEAAKKSVELNSQEPLFHTNLSRIYQQKGMIQEAEDAMALANSQS